MRREAEDCVAGAETLEHGWWGRRERGLIRQCPPPSSLLGPPWRHCRDASMRQTDRLWPWVFLRTQKGTVGTGKPCRPIFLMFTDPGNLGKVFPSVKWLLCFLRGGVLVSDSRIFFFLLWKSNPLRSLVDINYIRYVPFTDESVLLFDTIHGLLVRKPLGLRDETNKIRFQDCSFQTVTPVEESQLDYDRWNFLSLGTKICKPKRLFRGQENLTLIGMENRKYKEMTSHSVKWWMRGE